MLDKFRTHTKGWLGMLILVIVSVPFALWGIQNYATSGSEKPIATVGQQNIYQADVNRAYQERLNQLQAQYGADFAPDMVDEPRLRREVLTGLVQRQLLEQVVHQDGYAVSDQQVLKLVGEIPGFQTDGKFDKSLYQQALRSRNQSSNEFLALVKQSLRADQLVKGVSETALVDDSEIRALYTIFAQTREIEYLTLSMEKMMAQVEVDDSEIQAYYDLNKDRYQTPEKVSVQYLELKAADIADTFELKEDELKTFYESELDRFTTLGKRRVSHILFEVAEDASEEQRQVQRSLAEHALSRLDKGEEFAQLAKELSNDTGSAENGGDLGVISEGMMPGPFEDTVFSLAQGQISDVVETDFGYHIIKLTELTDKKLRPYEEVKAEVERTYRQQLANEQFIQTAERLSELTYQNPSVLDPAASELGLTLQTSDLFAQAEGEGVAAEEAVRQAAFSQDVLEGNNSDVIELADGHVLVLRVDQHLAAQPQPLADVRAAIELEVIRQKAATALRERADALKQAVMDGQALQTLADDELVTYQPPVAFKRNDQDQPVEIINQAFAMPKPQGDPPTVDSMTRSNGDVILIALQKVEAGDPETMRPNDKRGLNDFMTKSRGQSAMAAVMAEMSKQYEVTFAENEAQQAQ